jgi:hypothetical protein
MKTLTKFGRLLILFGVLGSLAACDDVRVYGSVGMSSYGGYGSPRMGTSVRVGGRIY